MYKKNKNSFFLIIPAAGYGKRLNCKKPKAFLKFKGKTILDRTLKIMISLSIFSKIIVVIPYGKKMLWKNSIYYKNNIINVINGGNSRFDSVLNGINFLDKFSKKNDWILVHDAARCNISIKLVKKLISSLKKDKVGGILGFPLKKRDSIKIVKKNNKKIIKTSKKKNFWLSQTPQMFRYGIISRLFNLYNNTGNKAHDESEVMEYFGYEPKIIKSNLSNIKITFREDLKILK